MLRLLLTDFIKLKRSLILLLILGIPAMLMIVQIAFVATGNAPSEWNVLAMSGSAIWAYFLLPMTATALTALLAHIEHNSRGWSYILTLPYPKWMVFLSKAILSSLIMAIISALILCAILLGGHIGGLLSPENALSGAFPFSDLPITLVKMWIASLLLIALQFTLAMRFSSFALPCIVGILGTFVAVVATSAKAGIYFPWLLPTNILASSPERAFQAMLSGGIGGVIFFALACFYLGRRDWA